MQKGIIKEVKEIAKEGKKTFYEVILQDDAKMSTFDPKIKQGESGDVLEFDVAIAGKYINLKDGWNLTKQTSSSHAKASDNGYQMSKEEWADKQRIERESIEAQAAIKTILPLDGTREDFKRVYDKALRLAEQMIDARLKPIEEPKRGEASLIKPSPESEDTVHPAVIAGTGLLEWVALNMGWANPSGAKTWIVNVCKIPEKRIDEDPIGVMSEVAKQKNWTLPE